MEQSAINGVVVHLTEGRNLGNGRGSITLSVRYPSEVDWNDLLAYLREPRTLFATNSVLEDTLQIWKDRALAAERVFAQAHEAHRIQVEQLSQQLSFAAGGQRW